MSRFGHADELLSSNDIQERLKEQAKLPLPEISPFFMFAIPDFLSKYSGLVGIGLTTPIFTPEMMLYKDYIAARDSKDRKEGEPLPDVYKDIKETEENKAYFKKANDGFSQFAVISFPDNDFDVMLDFVAEANNLGITVSQLDVTTNKVTHEKKIYLACYPYEYKKITEKDGRLAKYADGSQKWEDVYNEKAVGQFFGLAVEKNLVTLDFLKNQNFNNLSCWKYTIETIGKLEKEDVKPAEKNGVSILQTPVHTVEKSQYKELINYFVSKIVHNAMNEDLLNETGINDTVLYSDLMKEVNRIRNKTEQAREGEKFVQPYNHEFSRSPENVFSKEKLVLDMADRIINGSLSEALLKNIGMDKTNIYYDIENNVNKIRKKQENLDKNSKNNATMAEDHYKKLYGDDPYKVGDDVPLNKYEEAWPDPKTVFKQVEVKEVRTRKITKTVT